jgi:hypothetical protein
MTLPVAILTDLYSASEFHESLCFYPYNHLFSICILWISLFQSSQADIQHLYNMTLPFVILTSIYSASVYHDSPCCYPHKHIFSICISWLSLLLFTNIYSSSLWRESLCCCPHNYSILYIQDLNTKILPIANLTDIHSAFVSHESPCC